MMIQLLNKTSTAVCLRGFGADDFDAASRFLAARGHRVVKSLQAAQCVVAGPDADVSLLESSRAKGLDVVTWSAIQEEARDAGLLAALSDPGEVPLAVETVHPLLRFEGETRLLLDIALPVCAPRSEEDRRFIPQSGRFQGLCFDQPFVETLHAVLTGASHNMPVGLEGVTAASKTTAVLYLAYLLDEMNLAEPQVLERLNCALELPSTLVLSEGCGTVFGPGGDVEIDENFRLLATLNPAEYSGRSVMSPAFRNRWLIWHQAHGADESSILAMLRTLSTGEQPVVHWHGKAYQAAAGVPLFPRLQEMPDFEAVLARFAMFHTTVAKAAGAADTMLALARHRRERESFTRRNLLATLQLATGPMASTVLRKSLSNAIQKIYINRFSDAADCKAIQSHLRAADLMF